jgi:hypothetical protein
MGRGMKPYRRGGHPNSVAAMHRMNHVHYAERDGDKFMTRQRRIRQYYEEMHGEMPVDVVMTENRNRFRHGDEMFAPERIMEEDENG